MAAHLSTVQSSRVKTMIVPREHGAWGMMLVPLATGAVVALRSGVNGFALMQFILAAMALFWLRTPLEAWLGTSAIKAQAGQERALVLRAQALVKKLGREGRMPAQMIGALGLTSTAAGAYYVATGQLDHTAVALWIANWLFAGDQIHFVQVRIRSSRAAT